VEREHLILIATGNIFSESWTEKEQPVDFYFLKGVVENIFRKAGISHFTVSTGHHAMLQSALAYSINKQEVSVVGNVDPAILSYFDIKREVYYAEFDAEALLRDSKNTITYKPSPRFPAVRRDLALVIDKQVSFGIIEELARKASGKLLKNVD